ncbi:hypothetical protein AtubIFM55763_000716 [Aspergillus tubingensis]|uniref:Uncharacterized protein n=2 Tax=Aspergillus subgen. Circumdati TaxID=2720871 RepID=A0A1L9N537_ASPTC|nr:hypothetical protein ASPTUDRAFT_120720 [Aspergillus tubingensis CBS 134.48]GLA78824.1 hypothetical protein AtubIFM55763_000716 [Aspergillus tubingensis]GLA96530.1 hypothetical protein AtubIFM57143_004000 [Aspergillus tubingensis]GLB23499.1 hypothetical protein AtubIFM61612_004094 [Aspergillus tubingensis]
MPRASPARILGGTTLLSTFITTILDGMCFTFSRSLSSRVSSVESAIVSLGAVSCLALVSLMLLWIKDIKSEPTEQCRNHRAIAYGLIAAYLSVATGVTAGGIAWSAAQSVSAKKSVTRHQSLLVARCTIWAISVLSQGILGGYFLTTLARRESTSKWSPPSVSQELEVLSDKASVKDASTVQSSSLASESQRPSADLKTNSDTVPPIQPSVSNTESQASNRYSGRTLFQHDSKQSSFDLQRSYVPHGDSTATPATVEEHPVDQAVSAAVGAKLRPEPPKIRRSYSDTKRSLDGLVRQPSSARSSPATSSTQLVTPARPAPPKLKLPDESFIHPLFRSDSSSPPPTPMPGTTVIASPAAGQTISVQALNRVRSTRSLRSQAPRSRSPLFDQPLNGMDRNTESPEPSGRGSPMPSFIMAADVRSSISRYEKKYDLNESPDES